MKKILLTFIFSILLSTVAVAEENTITFEDFQKECEQQIAAYSNTVATSSMYYDQLTEHEKSYYSHLRQNIRSLLQSNEFRFEIKDMTLPTGIETSKEVLSSAVDQLGTSIATFAIRPVYALCYLDCPEFFWVDINKVAVHYGVSGYNEDTGKLNTFYIYFTPKTNMTNYLPNCFTDYQDAQNEYTAMCSKVNQIADSVPENYSQWARLNYYVNWLRDNCHYNTSISTATKQIYLPTSALLHGNESTNAPVCEGYAEALKILCDLSEIDCMAVESFYTVNSKKTGHKWLLINIDGKYYHCDPTWFDRSGISAYNYFLTGSQNMFNYDKTQNHTISYQYSFYSPEISENDYLYNMGISKYNLLNADGNDIIEEKDISSLLREITLEAKGNDVNSDGEINILDVIKMQRLFF